MEKKINIAQLLKDCPKGMELDCVMYENLYFDYISNNKIYPICCYTEDNLKAKHPITFTWYGRPSQHDSAKCVIFPKGKTTWEGFVPPCKFKDGDIVATTRGSWIGITKGGENNSFIPTYCVIDYNDEFEAYFDRKEQWSFSRLATEEEKQKLFQAIKDNGYKWNAETKTLEKLIEPKFKVGDNIRMKGTAAIYVVTEIREDRYMLDDKDISLLFKNQDQWELFPNKFDISTLVPFESKVLVRNSDSGFWKPAFWGIYEAEKSNEHQYRNYLTTEGFVRHCIPYNDETKHLVGKTSNCPEYYKTW